ncbi:MAG: MmgE/PrpD family protein [Chloroflexi bacterium]|nr:MmgE/PrpD family protein [Chloroflexota bacterium]
MDASFALAHNVANIRFEDIPAEAIKVAKMSVLDNLGTTLAATTLAPACHKVVDLVKEAGGKAESTIIGFGGRSPSWMAALVNSTMAHSQDYDDIHEKAKVHGGSAIVPAGFAVAERVGKVDGKTFLTALILGMDVAFRMSLAVPLRVRGFHRAAVYGIFGAAAAAARILGLKEDRVQHTLGIAYSQAAGNSQAAVDASLTERLQVGFAAHAGVLSALLAEKGITGAINSLEGEFGFYKVYCGGDYDPSALTSELGKRFEASNIGFKPYPCGRGTHSSIDATLEIVREHDLRPQDVESIRVLKIPAAAKVEGTPIERKRRPDNVVDAQTSIPYTVAVAVVKRAVGLRDFTPGAMKDAAVLQVAERVSVEAYPELGDSFHPGITEIKTKDGKVYSRRIDKPSGNPENPIPREVLIQKFMDCASYSAKPLTKNSLENVIEMVMKLEKVDDVGSVVRLLA